MTLIHHNKKRLEEIKGLFLQLPQELFTAPKEILSGATVGQHFRHILEFYICLEKGAKTGTVSYDERERNLLIETDMAYALSSLEKIIHFLTALEKDHALTMKANYSSASGEQTIIQTSLYRELAYALDHTVHHLAIVRIALSQEKDKVKMDSNFGVAPSTIRYREQCVA